MLRRQICRPYFCAWEEAFLMPRAQGPRGRIRSKTSRRLCAQVSPRTWDSSAASCLPSADSCAFVPGVLGAGKQLKSRECTAGAQGSRSWEGLGQTEFEFCPPFLSFWAPLQSKENTTKVAVKSATPPTALPKGLLGTDRDSEDGGDRPECHGERATALFSDESEGSYHFCPTGN